jgi:hypothetical protein
MSETLKGRDHIDEPGVDRTILKWISTKLNMGDSSG